MENNVMNEVMENENNEVVDEIVPVVEVIDDETSESTLSKKDMVVGVAVLTLATAGAVALGRGLYKGGKAIIGKIMDKAANVTAPIDEKPVEVHMPEEQVEVVNETE